MKRGARMRLREWSIGRRSRPVVALGSCLQEPQNKQGIVQAAQRYTLGPRRRAHSRQYLTGTTARAPAGDGSDMPHRTVAQGG